MEGVCWGRWKSVGVRIRGLDISGRQARRLKTGRMKGVGMTGHSLGNVR